MLALNAASVAAVRPISAPTRLADYGARYIGLRCPDCGADLIAITYHALGQAHASIECHACFHVLSQDHGIWLTFAKDRLEHFRQFLRNYELVRKAEGRGSDTAQFYLSLPYRDLTGHNSQQWSIRARTFQYIQRKLLPQLAANSSQPLTILDLGAGNGWLCYRLAQTGHRPIAVDLQTSAFDGLGAAIHYQQVLPMLFPRFQAEMDRLPFSSGQFDVAIFNASFHYSEDYSRTVAEAIRCLRPGGTVVIADSPTYCLEESGRQMLKERRHSFQQRFGFTSDSLSSQEYLTAERLRALEDRHNLQWITHEIWYGLRWACRPLIATLKGRREPSQFRIYTAQVKTA
jgi:SAM-dependent methyltransferase